MSVYFDGTVFLSMVYITHHQSETLQFWLSSDQGHSASSPLCAPSPRASTSTPPALVPFLDDFEQAKLCWLRDCQSHLQNDGRFTLWKCQLDLFEDKPGVWRCGGRMSKSCLSLSAKNPILLDRSHHFTRLVVIDAHLCVLHNGVKETLTELRSEYWLVKGRQFVQRLIHACTVSKRGKPPTASA